MHSRSLPRSARPRAVFNFYEPLHYLAHNSGFQTWEQSPQFAIRSYFYILLHWPLAHLAPHFLGLGKRQQFFALRLSLGAVSSFVEARFVRAIVEAVNERVGRYVFFSLLFSAGMWSAGVAFLPSSFAMHTTMLAASFWFHPATSTATGVRRMFGAVFATALGAIVGWPFAAALGVPIVLEQLFAPGGEIVQPEQRASWGARRATMLTGAVVLSGLAITIPVVAVDSWAYGRLVFPSLNIVRYNVLENHSDLYGTEPATYYLANLFLNFNALSLFALLSLPALAITYRFDFRRLGKTQMKPKVGESSPYVLLAARLAPFYIWLAILTAQPHKEERFMFPAYGFLCFNAAVTVYLAKGWLETYYIHLTKSPYRASQTSLFSRFALACILVPSLVSVLRIIGMFSFYHAPLDVVHHFEYKTVPSILADMGYAPTPLAPYKGEVEYVWDPAPLLDSGVTLCYGAEWHRFPGSYLVNDGINVQWIRSEFDGMMPRKWNPSGPAGYWPRAETRVVHPGRFNDDNDASAEPGTYVPVGQCDYLVSLTLPSQKPTALQPDYAHMAAWHKDYCTTFLDAAASKWWARLVWLPFNIGDSGRVYGEYCLLRNVGK